MRTLIRDGVLIDGTGASPIGGASIVIDDHIIEEILHESAPPYDRSAHVIDAEGGYILPGILNHHAHGMTRGPLMILGEPALPDDRVRWNRLRMLKQGVTRVLNVDGFAVVEEGRAASNQPGLTVMTSTLHTPFHLEWATTGPFTFGGILPRHRSTIETELRLGSPAIGEIGPGIDDHWIDYTIMPYGLARRGGHPNGDVGRRLRIAGDQGDRDTIVKLIAETGAEMSVDELEDLLTQGREWCRRALLACEEALDAAADFDVPVIMHHTPPTFELVLSAAERLGPRLICAHSNFAVLDPKLAVAHARALREHGALIDVMTGDVDGAKSFLASDDVTHAMMRAGCVDLISTDYAAGYWDSMLLVIERAVAAGAMVLEDAVHTVTGRVAEAVPRFASQRGTLELGKVADVVVTHPGSLSRVKDVLVSGEPVRLPVEGNGWGLVS